MKNKHPVILIILDGWGIRQNPTANAAARARTPFLDKILATYPRTQLICCGKAVGLPPGGIGNSEVGHLNIGSGRIVFQDLLKINRSIDDRTFFKNETFRQIMADVKERDSALHLMGLLSDGGVHSHINHLLALLDMAHERGVSRVFVHGVLDGRDTFPNMGLGYVQQVQDHIEKIGFPRIATLCGRFYAMDRDTRWDRVEKAYRLYTSGEGIMETNPINAVKCAYRRGETDEFVKPIVITDNHQVPLATVQDGDGIIFFNFRADRAREITRAFTDSAFDFFKRPSFPNLCKYVCMTRYDKEFTLPTAYPPTHLSGVLGEVISKQGLNQLRIAETEKYAHVTYFFNGGEEKPFIKEDRCLIPSPRDVATYDLKPEMSAELVTDEVISRLNSGKYDFSVLNYANMDMVGHTGFLKAAISACETVDVCLERVVTTIQAMGGTAIVTADHGNSETMADENGHPHTAHTFNPVHFILVDESRLDSQLRKGVLGDIAPTVLQLMGIEKPIEMSGRSLIIV